MACGCGKRIEIRPNVRTSPRGVLVSGASPTMAFYRLINNNGTNLPLLVIQNQMINLTGRTVSSKEEAITILREVLKDEL